MYIHAEASFELPEVTIVQDAEEFLGLTVFMIRNTTNHTTTSSYITIFC